MCNVQLYIPDYLYGQGDDITCNDPIYANNTNLGSVNCIIIYTWLTFIYS